MSDFGRYLAGVLDEPGDGDAEARVSSIKTAVSRQMEAVDTSVSIKFTPYFNSSIAPDMVIRWPREARTRLLYLRSAEEASWIDNDVEELHEGNPIIFAMGDLYSEDQKEKEASKTDTAEAHNEERLSALLQASKIMITSAGGLASLTDQRDGTVRRLLSQAVMRGGRGLIDRAVAQSAATATSSGFEGARSLQAEPTRRAAETLPDILDAPEAGRMLRLLKSVWVGSGGNEASFPSQDALFGPLTLDDLQYLLLNLDASPRDFWRTIAMGVTTEQLARLDPADMDRNLNDLVLAMVDRLMGKAVRVVAESDQLGEADFYPRWTVRRGCLSLRGRDWTAYVAARRQDELSVVDEGAGVQISELRRRARRARVSVRDVQLRGTRSSVTWEAIGNANVVEDEEFSRFASGVAIAERVTIQAAAVRVTCDFLTRTAAGNTSATFNLDDLMAAAVPMLEDLTTEEWAEFSSMWTGSDEDLMLDVPLLPDAADVDLEEN